MENLDDMPKARDELSPSLIQTIFANFRTGKDSCQKLLDILIFDYNFDINKSYPTVIKGETILANPMM